MCLHRHQKARRYRYKEIVGWLEQTVLSCGRASTIELCIEQVGVSGHFPVFFSNLNLQFLDETFQNLSGIEKRTPIRLDAF